MSTSNRLNKKSKQGGFTLVEIAIVLVIIGLILGGVLQGQTMIENARYRNFVKEVDSYRAAFHTFRDMQRALPGDMSTVRAQATLNPAATGGNGLGTIGGALCNANNDESCRVWSHLRYAELIPGDPTLNGPASSPNHAYGGLVSGMETSTAGNGVNENKLRLLNVPGDVAQRYDTEFDDGNAKTGRVSQTAAGATYNPAVNVTLVIAL